MLCFLTLDTGDLWELDDDVSARPMIVVALEHITAKESAAATVFKLHRAYKYQVDFYLHRETPDWYSDILDERFIDLHGCTRIRRNSFA